ncbi:hypothetical protein SESBI_41765 [Sesbania bispinosa]|nr:hypothetical protein SESBI_41765 [Sesbania bispinosa]
MNLSWKQVIFLVKAFITHYGRRNKGMETAYTQIPHSADRPIIGVVAAHGNEDENSHISPAKWWDVNGIPNSTTKYKEDQKVMWHATTI